MAERDDMPGDRDVHEQATEEEAPEHPSRAAEAGVGRLAAAGFAMTNLGVVGKECRADEEVVGFCKWAIG